jgi:hypothetical protein
MSTHCVLRVVDPVRRLARELLQRLQISHPMVSLVVASAPLVAVLTLVVVSPQVAAWPVAALHLHQVLAFCPLLLVQELQLQLRQPAERLLLREEPRLA